MFNATLRGNRAVILGSATMLMTFIFGSPVLFAKAETVVQSPASGVPSTPHAKTPGESRHSENHEKNRSRIEELFKWKVSDSLNLASDDENKFSQIMKELADKRKVISERIERLVQQMVDAKGDKEREGLLRSYQEELKNQSDLQIQEVQKLKALFGTEKMTRYLVLKNDLSLKLRGLLSGRHGGEKSSDRSGDGGKDKGKATARASEKKDLPEPSVTEGN